MIGIRTPRSHSRSWTSRAPVISGNTHVQHDAARLLGVVLLQELVARTNIPARASRPGG